MRALNRWFLLGLMFASAGPCLAGRQNPSSREIVNLNGQWFCEPGERDKMPSAWTHKAPVPGLVDLCKPALDTWASQYFWYKTTFRLDAGSRRPIAFIRIEQSQFGVEVWLNGKNIGRYDGCYTSHEYDTGDALVYGGENTLLVRIGQKGTLPPDNTAGGDVEKMSFIPGIWGDVSLVLSGDPRIRAVRVLPHIDRQMAEATVSIETESGTARNVTVSAVVREKKSGKEASQKVKVSVSVEPRQKKEVVLELPLAEMHLWSPDDPFLYELDASLIEDPDETDCVLTTFGMRDFRIRGSDFYLNGQRIFLRGSNLAFHRFLSDPARRALPWNPDWIKRVLIDIPKANGFNYFRNHLGQMYNCWYDLADEYGMLLQNEWMFWGRLSVSEASVTRDFDQWIEDNYNHPSIVIWDPLNEPEDNPEALKDIAMLKEKIVPHIKKIDPMRPWEVADFTEEHPYIYSLGPVLNDATFGFARSIEAMQNSAEPTVLNEFVWFWLRNDGKPTSFTDEVVLRWLGPDTTARERLAYQAFLATELVEQFRRMRVDGIAPFVYLGPDNGPTANWFLGDIEDLRPKPIVAALKNAYRPFGVSVELWDRHFFTNETRTINVYVFNDFPEPKSGSIQCRILDGSKPVFEKEQPVSVDGSGMQIVPVTWSFPAKPGHYQVEAKLVPAAFALPPAYSRKDAHVFERVEAPAGLKDKRVVVHDPDGEILDFLRNVGVNAVPFHGTKLWSDDLLVIGEGGLTDELYASRRKELGTWIAGGGTMMVVEPSYGIEDHRELALTDQIGLDIRRKKTFGRDGYDSAVWPVSMKDPFWMGISKEHLRLFNGGYGGVMVSDYEVVPNGLYLPRAHSGLGLGTAVLLELMAGKGALVVSRIQVRGRLVAREGSGGLYDRRVDPVAQRYFLNLLATYARYRPRGIVPLTGNVRASSGNEGECAAAFAVDGNPKTRWSSAYVDPQWLVYDLGAQKVIRGVTIEWERAFGREYEIQVSDDGRMWKSVYHETNGDGDRDEISFAPVQARYVCLLGRRRGTGWGYSIWELKIRE